MQDSEMVVVNGQQATTGDENLFVKFYMHAVKHGFESEKAGRPIFVDRLYISIMSPGSNLSRIERPATDDDKQRFPKQWMSYQNNQNVETTGTPLAEWPVLTRGQVEELRALKFYSVEQIAAATDAQLQAVGPMGFSYRTKAIAYIKTAKDSAAVQRQATENAQLRADNARLQEQIATLAARLTALEEGGGGQATVVADVPRRGRPRKVAVG